MKKLYRRRGTVHPSPPIISDHLSFLPAAILTLAAALSPDDREVLAYLISSSVNNFSVHRGKANAAAVKIGSDHHPPVFSCGCFRCYTSYWIRWDSSPNRQLIHAIIDAYEEKLAQSKAGKSNKKERKKKKSSGLGFGSGSGSEACSSKEEPTPLTEMDATGNGGEKEAEKGAVRWMVSYIGERIWGGWDY